jgi:PilZ domain
LHPLRAAIAPRAQRVTNRQRGAMVCGAARHDRFRLVKIDFGQETDVAINGKRRSERVLIDVPLIICGNAPDKKPFREETFTVTVSAHGALVVLASKVELGQRVKLTKTQSDDEREATVAFLGPPYAGLSTVGLQFETPSPEFWPVGKPPADWSRA